MTRLAEYADARELTVNLTLRELRSRYKRSLLGWTWSLLNPLSSVITFGIVFAYFLKIQPPVGHPSGLHNFAMFLLCGLLPWNFLAGGMNASLDSLIGNSNLIRKVYFPREVLVVSTVGSLVVTLLVELGVLIAILLLFGNMVLPWIPMLLVVVVLQTAFVLGIGLMLSVTNVYFRDVKHFIGISLNALFYSAPIVYPISYVADKHPVILGWHVPLLRIYNLNPLVRLVTLYRDVLYDLRFPRLVDLAYVTVWSAALLVVGLWVFRRLDRRLAEEV
jgi:ABC-2 type transport system permease protein